MTDATAEERRSCPERARSTETRATSAYAKTSAFPATSSQSGRRDLNSGPLVPQTSALTRLRHAPSTSHSSRRLVSGKRPPG